MIFMTDQNKRHSLISLRLMLSYDFEEVNDFELHNISYTQ